MDIFEIAGNPIGINRTGVNFLEPSVSYQNLYNGYVFRQKLQSRKGFRQFGTRLGSQGGDLTDNSRVMGIFNFIKPDESSETLAVTQEFLYKYVPATQIWTQIANVGFVSFGISTNDDYVSGTAYPSETNTQRFIFCSTGMTDIYVYNGTDVQIYTNVAATPFYIAPAGGALTKAKYVEFFGGRLNFFNPVIGGTAFNQMILYSGIANAAGNGDNFNIVGAGDLSADTSQYINGVTIAGDYLLLNFNRSNWTIEKTRDAFNPYFIRKIPSVLGTDAAFSSVSWNNEAKSIGKTGIISSDGRSSLRIDDALPYFTADNIVQSQINESYGGFDRINDQFLFTYVNGSTEPQDVLSQSQVLVHNYKESTWSINNQRFSVLGESDQGIELTWSQIDETINPEWLRWDTTEDIWNKIGIESTVQKTLAGDDKSFIYQLNVDYDDYYVDVTNITQASLGVATISPCAIQVRDAVVFENVVGMTEINGINLEVTAIGETNGATTSITVNLDTTDYTAYDSLGSVSKLINFYAELVPFNPYRDHGRKVNMSHIEFLVNTKESALLVDIYADEQDSPFKANVPITPTQINAERQWVMMTVNQEANFINIVMKQSSVSKFAEVTSVRIHCSPGSFTHD